MSLRLQTLQVARLAANPLRESADRVVDFLQSQHNDDGGFADRAGSSDLYYTVFGLQCLLALQQPIDAPRVARFLNGFDPAQQDLVHAGSLARCWASLPDTPLPEGLAEAIGTKVESHRTADGGYSERTGSSTGSCYGAFVALGALQDAGLATPDPEAIGTCLSSLATGEGGYANDSDIRMGNVPGTAAAVTIQHQLELPIDPASADFLLSCCHPEGGFFAMPEAPMPDLLSTATALHALSCTGRDVSKVQDPCLDYVDTLWTSRGGFYGHWAEEEDALDVEYTYYGLLALGHLSL